MKTISLKVSGALNEKLAALARQRRTTKSAVIREALEAFCTDGEKRRRTSWLDRIRDLVGSVEGPGDLSVNKKYMEGFGQ
jgi:predicted transcriptional regulator